jgi:hypothetical protein
MFLTLPVGLAGAETLFDGASLARFRTPTRATGPEVSWRIEDGVLASIADARRQCDLWTVAEYEHFELSFGWRVAPGANSGIKYLIQAAPVDHLRDAQGEFLHETSLGFEFQLVDDASPAGADSPTHCSGALYNYLPPTENAARPAGEWNTGKLRVTAAGAEHWLNGRCVLDYRFDAPELRSALAKRNAESARLLEKLEKRRTPVAFQHHESTVYFRDIRIETLK